MNQQDPLSYIAHQLHTKSSVKQKTYKNLCHTFRQLERQTKAVTEQINLKIKDLREDVTVKMTRENPQEFHLKVAGDLLVFVMHTNIITLDKAHGYNKSKYVEEDGYRRYLGQINVYNFMADSFRYNRLNDPGYLLSRLFINHENHFLVEGERQLDFMYEEVSSKPVEPSDLSIFIQLLITQAIESDLITPAFPDIRAISVREKLEKTQQLGAGSKIGFQMQGTPSAKS